MDYNFVIDIRGDKRYEYLAKRLSGLGYDVFYYENFTDKSGNADLSAVNGINSNPIENFTDKGGIADLSAVNGIRANPSGNFINADSDTVYIFPPSVRISRDAAEKLRDGATLFAFAEKAAADTLFKKRIRQIDLFSEENFAYKNAMITADGALMLAAENTDIVFSDMNILIVGFGRVGKSLARIFKILSKRVDVLTFDRGEYAAAPLFSDGRYGSFDDAEFGVYDVVINTVPARLINKHIVARFKEGVFLLELASEPGGFDGDAVKKSGIKFLNASGLPAKVAPVSAGKILLEEIAAHLGIAGI
ncbi:MAG: hypothetical protein LBP62_00745 [Clostridiales bacterium]|jgi:dipicolinate synthase subunit A|nr:hypothetical protein [Clostridiales bacterium]